MTRLSDVTVMVQASLTSNSYLSASVTVMVKGELPVAPSLPFIAMVLRTTSPFFRTTSAVSKLYHVTAEKLCLPAGTVRVKSPAALEVPIFSTLQSAVPTSSSGPL